MKIRLTVIVLLFSLLALSQKDTANHLYDHLDTLEMIAVNTNALLTPDSSVYYVYNDRVDKLTYDSYNDFNLRADTCTPCLLKAYDRFCTLIWIGEMYSDCPVGSWTEFYPGGKVKVVGQHRRNNTGSWRIALYQRGFCGVREGVWTYYDEQGNITKTETYRDNQLVP